MYVFFLIFICCFYQIINGKYVEGFYIYARQLLDTGGNGITAHTNPLIAAARSSSSTSVAYSSSAALISALKPNIARRDGTAIVTPTTQPLKPDAMQLSTTATTSYVGSAVYRMLTILNGGGASSCTMTGLLQYTLYEFFIVPFYKSVEGKPSNSRVARTLEDGKYKHERVFIFIEYLLYIYMCVYEFRKFLLLYM